jgi:tetratricopeptide (TPR) repeat protein
MDRLQMLIDFVKSNPDDPFPRYGLAQEYRNRGQIEQAAATFEELVARHPDYAASYLHYGNILVQLGRREDARKIYEAGITAATRKGDPHAAGELQGALLGLG